MSDKKPGPVEESIRRLREQRYMTMGPGAKRPVHKPSVDELREVVAKIPAKLVPKKPKLPPGVRNRLNAASKRKKATRKRK